MRRAADWAAGARRCLRSFLSKTLTAHAKRWKRRVFFLPYRDSEGQPADFHALRHTFLSRLDRSGASAKVMQRLARHSTVGLTLNRDTHAGLFDLQAAVEKLPPLPSTGPKPVEPETIRATGTDAVDVLPVRLPKRPARSRASVRSGAQPQ